MKFSYHSLITDLAGLKLHFQASSWVVAVSGGLDSMCLLHALVQLQRHHSCPSLRVIHINHDLQAQADQWQQDVEQQCQNYGLLCASYKVSLCTQEQGKLGLEAAARQARYAVFNQHLQAGEVLLLGQHADDQTETLFLRLLRGAGVAGLRAMPQQRSLGLGCLVRPLLHVRQTDLNVYAQTHQLSWCEDPSNQNSRFDRNYLRHQVMPLLRQRWPALDKRIATVASVMGDAQLLLDEVACADLVWVRKGYGVGERLHCEKLKDLSRARRHNLLRYWLDQHHIAMPDHATMKHIDREFLYSAQDGQPYLQLGDWCLRRNQGHLLLMRRSDQSNMMAVSWHYSVESQTLLRGLIALPDGIFCLKKEAQVGLMLAPGDYLERRFRAGGERCKPLGRAHSQSLKKLLQEAKVPAWERDHLPLFYVNGKLAMVADLWVNSGFEAALGDPAWCWQKAT
jgi:tRNA(Ile)-lysidine synthase